MGRTDEMMDLTRQMIQRNKKSMARVRRKLKEWIAEGGLTQKEIAKFRYEIVETEKAIDELERFLIEKDLA